MNKPAVEDDIEVGSRFRVDLGDLPDDDDEGAEPAGTDAAKAKRPYKARERKGSSLKQTLAKLEEKQKVMAALAKDMAELLATAQKEFAGLQTSYADSEDDTRKILLSNPVVNAAIRAMPLLDNSRNHLVGRGYPVREKKGQA